MDPITMGGLGIAMGLVGAGTNIMAANKAQAGAEATAAATEQGARAQADAMRAQAESDQAVAKQNQMNAEAKALEERVAGQRQAGEEIRSARLAQSRLGAVAGASGSGASDPTVMKMFEGIDKEGTKNAGYATASAEQKARSITYQAALDRWTADSNAGIKLRSSNDTILGGSLQAQAARMGGQASAMSGYGNAFGSLSSMALRYGTPGKTSGSTGYGR